VDNSGVHPPVSVYDLASGTLTTVLTRTPGIVYQLAWSPDGTRLAVAGRSVTTGDDTPALTVVDRQGHVVRTWAAGVAVWGVQWSPDGRELGWLAQSAGSDLFIADVDQATVERLLISATRYDDGRWGWSPDGDWLAYDTLGGIAVRARDGSSVRRIHGCSAPAWRPK
jgi:Tol biopolymer transport system component